MKHIAHSLRVLIALAAALSTSPATAKTKLYERPQTHPIETPQVSLAPKRENLRESGSSWSHVIKGNPIVSPGQAVTRAIETLLPGTIERASIRTSVQAFGNSKAPVQAKIVDQNGRDILLLGEATLEPNSKRITIEFGSAIISGTDEVFDLKAHALDTNGTLGLKGDYVSGEQRYFAAEFLASAAAGFADASISRSTNVLGNQTEERSIDTSGKKAVGSALSRTADRFAEKVRAAPEYSILEGPTTIQVLIIEQPRRNL